MVLGVVIAAVAIAAVRLTLPTLAGSIVLGVGAIAWIGFEVWRARRAE
jgi:hypothetical protein